MNDLYVAPESRWTGAGTALLSTAETFARDGGAVGIMLSTAHDNHTAQRVYVKRGFVHDAAFRDYVKYF